MFRFTIRDVLWLTVVVAAYFGGRASMQPRIRTLEERDSMRQARIAKLEGDVAFFNKLLNDEALSAAREIGGLPPLK